MKVKLYISEALDGSGKKEKYLTWRCDKCEQVGFNWLRDGGDELPDMLHCEGETFSA